MLDEARRAPRAQAPLPRDGRAAPAGDGAFFEDGGPAAPRRARGDALPRGTRWPCRARTSPATSWSPPPPRASWARRPTRSPARCGPSAASSTCSSTWPTIDGVAFFNDSKATNVEAARQSLEAFAQPVLVILGGRYKGGDFADLAPALRAHGRARARDRRGAGAHRAAPRRRRARRPLRLAARRGRARAGRGAARRRRAARAGLLLLRHVPRLRRARPRLQGRGAAPGRRERAGRPVAKKLTTDLVLVAVTVALIGFGLVMVWSASSALAQERHGNALPLPDQAGRCGPSSASSPWWPPCASTTGSCAGPRSSTACSSPRPSCLIVRPLPAAR